MLFPNALPSFPTSRTSTAPIMRFTAKAVLADYVKRDGTQCVEIRAIIDRKQACVSLGFCMHAKDFNIDRGIALPNVPNAELINFQISEAVMRANKIFLDYKYSDRYLTPELFRKEFIDPSSTANFNDFMEKEIELRKPKLEKVTHGSHVTTLKKLRKFQNRLLFAELNVEFCQRFENFLIKTYKLKQNSVHKVIRTIKVYLHVAERKGIHFKNPFDDYKVKQVAPQKPTLSVDEIKSIMLYYKKQSTPQNHKKVARYFLFSCFTGIRISDIMRIEWNNIHGDSLQYLPHKTRKRNKFVSVPMTALHKNLMGEFTGSKYLFDTYTEQVTNRILKEIAMACEIKKVLTYHISRHTFGTLFMDQGGQLDTLQQLLGHSMITTTMQYDQVKTERKHAELEKAFDSNFLASV